MKKFLEISSLELLICTIKINKKQKEYYKFRNYNPEKFNKKWKEIKSI